MGKISEIYQRLSELRGVIDQSVQVRIVHIPDDCDSSAPDWVWTCNSDFVDLSGILRLENNGIERLSKTEVDTRDGLLYVCIELKNNAPASREMVSEFRAIANWLGTYRAEQTPSWQADAMGEVGWWLTLTRNIDPECESTASWGDDEDVQELDGVYLSDPFVSITFKPAERILKKIATFATEFHSEFVEGDPWRHFELAIANLQAMVAVNPDGKLLMGCSRPLDLCQEILDSLHLGRIRKGKSVVGPFGHPSVPLNSKRKTARRDLEIVLGHWQAACKGQGITLPRKRPVWLTPMDIEKRFQKQAILKVVAFAERLSRGVQLRRMHRDDDALLNNFEDMGGFERACESAYDLCHSHNLPCLIQPIVDCDDDFEVPEDSGNELGGLFGWELCKDDAISSESFIWSINDSTEGGLYGWASYLLGMKAELWSSYKDPPSIMKPLAFLQATPLPLALTGPSSAQMAALDLEERTPIVIASDSKKEITDGITDRDSIERIAQHLRGTKLNEFNFLTTKPVGTWIRWSVLNDQIEKDRSKGGTLRSLERLRDAVSQIKDSLFEIHVDSVGERVILSYIRESGSAS
jgi:hypothetical protein